MVREKVYSAQGYELKYIEAQDGLVITGYYGRALRMEVPACIDGSPVVGIGRKAFLSQKKLKHIVLPETIVSVEEWAFAYCSHLETVTLTGGHAAMGRAVFLDCSRLSQIISSLWREEVSFLLAAAVTVMDGYYLLDTEMVGTPEWLEKWDARLFAMMEEPDQEGYQKQVLCGEEDYGSTDMNVYLRIRRMGKAKLAMLRLLKPWGLTLKRQQYLEQYLKSHTKGCESEETWLLLLKEYSQDRERIQLFLDLGCADEQNMEGLLRDMGEACPEMKAIFLRYQASYIGYQDFFSDMSL